MDLREDMERATSPTTRDQSFPLIWADSGYNAHQVNSGRQDSLATHRNRQTERRHERLRLAAALAFVILASIQSQSGEPHDSCLVSQGLCREDANELIDVQDAPILLSTSNLMH